MKLKSISNVKKKRNNINCISSTPKALFTSLQWNHLFKKRLVLREIGSNKNASFLQMQLLTSDYIQLLKPYVNGVTLRGKNPTLKCCKPLELLTYFEMGLSSFNRGNMESVGQRAAKSLYVKLWDWFEPGQTRNRATPFLENSKFETLWL